MKKLSELMSYYYDTIYPALGELEIKREEVAKKLKLLKIILFSAVVAILVFFYFSGILIKDNINLVYWIVAVAGSLYIFGYKIIISSYKDNFKESVIKKIINFISPELKYYKENFISKEEVIWSNIFIKNIDRFSGNDLVEGKIGDTKVRFSDIKAEYKTRYKNRVHWHTLFQGQFFVADLNKEFNDHMLVLPDVSEKMLGQIGQFFQEHNPNREKLIKLDNPGFEKEFVVYADDEISSRYILTQSMMEGILKYKYKTKRDIYLSFRNSKIFVAIAFNKDLFEPDPFKSLNDFSPIREYYESLSLVIGIVDDLKLNRRIWSKK